MKGKCNVIQITKEEAENIRKLYPRAYIIRTSKQRSGRGRYFIDESSASIAALHQVREAGDNDELS